VTQRSGDHESPPKSDIIAAAATAKLSAVANWSCRTILTHAARYGQSTSSSSTLVS